MSSDKKTEGGKGAHQTGSHSPAAAGAAESDACLALLRQAADWQNQASKALHDGNSQSMFLRQQVGQLFDAVRQLYDAVSAQCIQLRDSDQALLRELHRFQTGGPQQAMAGVYAKLFRDLLGHMNQLDDLVAVGQKADRGTLDPAWLRSLVVARDHFEALLRDWGCTPVAVRVGEDEFDPQVHEAVTDGESAKRRGNKISAVSRRGWAFGGAVLQYPQVVVG